MDNVNSRNLPDASLAITSTTTVQDYMNFIRDAMGIVPGQTNPDTLTTGVTLNPLTGVINIVGNTGTMNDLTLNPSNFRLLDAAGTQIQSSLFSSSKAASADGESAAASFVAYDSLGSPPSTSTSASRSKPHPAAPAPPGDYYAEAGYSYPTSINLGSGLINFNSAGALLTTTPISVAVNRNGTGTVTPLNFDIALDGPQGSVTSFANTTGNSTLQAQQIDGSPLGTLQSFAVGADGIVAARVLQRPLPHHRPGRPRQVLQPEGLVDLGGNMYRVGPAQQLVRIAAPLELGTGKIVGGALELSNVDLGSEFLGLIQAQTGYSAATGVIRTTDELFQQLLQITG